MGYKSYLIDKFEFTHENKFFRLLDLKLKKTYQDEESEYILIGNISVQGHSLDAIFIKRGAIIVIDFKDYGGDLNVSENGPWRIKISDGETIFVAGGAHSRNPFQQVRAYRFALFQYLSNRESEILEKNHSNIKWDHTNCLVLFHQPVEVVGKYFGEKIKRYFHLTDFKRSLETFNDIHSNNLNLTNNEIHNIRKALNITDKDLYQGKIKDDEPGIKPQVDPARMDRILQLIPEVNKDNKLKRALGFYNTMVSIERTNDASVSNIHHYPIDWNQTKDAEYSINIENNKNFLQIFLENRDQNFPNNLFVSVDVKFEGNKLKIPLFYTIIVHSEIEDHENIDVNFKSFNIYRPVLRELQLTEDVIEELIASVSEEETLKDKVKAAEKLLDISIQRDKTFSLGLSQESLFTAQLQSELNQWIKNKRELRPGKVFESYLTNEPIGTSVEKSKQPLIQISQLNKSQKRSVQRSFEQPLSVITGPPGTGKSQVVTNILANATFRNEKVLFASRNNKAVDNVHQRLSEIFKMDYFLRLGSTDHNKDFVETLTSIINKINGEGLEDYSDKLSVKNKKYRTLIKEKNKLRKKINSLDSLKDEILTIKERLKSVEEEYEKWLNSLNERKKQLYLTKGLAYNISKSELNGLLRTVEKSQKGFFQKLKFNLFYKKNTVQQIIELNRNFPEQIQEFIDDNAPFNADSGSFNKGLIKNLEFIKRERQSQREIVEKNKKTKKSKKDDQHKVNEKLEQFETLSKSLNDMKSRVEEIENGQIDWGLDLMRLTIHESLRTANIDIIDSYSNYVQNGIPWQMEEQEECLNIIEAFLDIFNSISITSLTIKKTFVLEPEIFDLLVIDEASQCDITSALPLIYRAKRVVILGDSLQLPHITSVKYYEQKFVLDKMGLSPNKFDYVNQSLFNKADSVSNRSQLKTTFLKEHYRCHPEIVGFSNIHFYLAKAGQRLKIQTNASDFSIAQSGINWKNVEGEMQEGKNINQAEVNQCMQLVQKLTEQNPEASIGITTPFRHQADALIKNLNDLPINTENILCDVVHKFQGDEKDIMILSLVVTQNCRGTLVAFINKFSPFLLNVAVTRAKSALFVVGNKKYCKGLKDFQNNKTLLTNLADYAEQHQN